MSLSLNRCKYCNNVSQGRKYCEICAKIDNSKRYYDMDVFQKNLNTLPSMNNDIGIIVNYCAGFGDGRYTIRIPFLSIFSKDDFKKDGTMKKSRLINNYDDLFNNGHLVTSIRLYHKRIFDLAFPSS